MKDIIIGIYSIRNKINNKRYIGFSKNILRRWIEHKVDLKRNKKNMYLQNSWNKYGKDNFEFSILEECEEKFLKEKEIFWVNKLQTMIPNGYNSAIPGNGGMLEGLAGSKNPAFRKDVRENFKEIINLYTVEEISLSEIGKIFNCSKTCIKSILLENNILIKTVHKNYLHDAKDDIVDLYENKKLSLRKIGRMYKCSYLAIRRLLINCGKHHAKL